MGLLAGHTHWFLLVRTLPPVQTMGRGMHLLPVHTGLLDGQTHEPAELRNWPPIHFGGAAMIEAAAQALLLARLESSPLAPPNRAFSNAGFTWPVGV
jgi:hypothetical protein